MQLCELLPRDRAPKRRRLSTSDGDTGLLQRTFSVGAFAIGGGIVGVQHNTYSFPWTTRLLTALVNGSDPRHQYSSCTILLNVLHYKHQDHSNEPGTMNLLIPCSRWQGGQVWMADSTGSVHLDMHSGPGVLRVIEPPGIKLDPHVAHATFPWHAGHRLLVVAHHARGIGRLSVRERGHLAWAGFYLRES